MSTLAISSGGIPLKEDYSLKIHQQSPRYQTCSGASSAAGSRIYLQLYSSRTRSNIVTSKRSSRLPTGLCSLWPLLPLLMLLGLSPLSALVQKAAAAGTELNNCKIESNGDFVKQTNYLYYDHESLGIVIEDSDRLSHRITNRILKILLQSVAGYPQVKIQHCYTYDNHNITVLLDRVSGRTVSKHCQPPEQNTMGRTPDTMVNMEAWMVAGFNKARWLDTGQLVDAGPLGPQGRMGWFLPTSVVEKLWSKGKHVLDHWRALQTPELTRYFSLWADPDLKKLQPNYKRRAFKSSKCSSRRNRCATLFATDEEVFGGTLKSQIQKLDLYVDIVWLGDKLSSYVKRKVNEGKPVMFFNWHPNVLIATGNFSRINFPETHAEHKDNPEDCDFPVNQLTKVLWGPIKTGAPEAYHIISKMSFTDLEYDELLESLASSSSDMTLGSFQPSTSMSRSLEEVACKWIRKNQIRWGRWLPQSLREKPKIYLGGLFPLTGRRWAEVGLVKAAELAVEIVNQDPNILPSYNLEVIVNDTQCKRDVAIGQFIAMQRRQPPIAGILGPGCSDAAERIASLSQHFHLLMVTYGAQGRDMSDRNKYPYFFRTGPAAHLYKLVYPALFHKLGWQVVGTLTQSNPELPEYHLPLLDFLNKDKLLLASSSQSLVVRHKVLNTTGMSDIAKTLMEFKEQRIRVIIADVPSNVARQIMCEAFKQQMTGYDGYVWFLPPWYPLHWQDVDYYNSEPSLQEVANSPHFVQESVPCTTSEVEWATQGHFVLAQTTLAAPETRVAGGTTVKEYSKMYAQRCGDVNVEESLLASFVYDAVWVFANALDIVLQQNEAALETFGTEANARALQKAISNLSFSGVSGWIRFQGGNSNRILDLTIQQVFTNETRLIGQYKPFVSFGKNGDHPLLQLDTDRIHWLSPIGAILDDLNSEAGECFVESVRAHLGVSCTIASVIVIALTFLVILIVVVALLFSLKYRCDTKVKKLKAAHERMKELGLLSEEYSHLLAVDDWEISLENIVLNRELGEGAFGAVMGGEMFKEKEGWVAVAVKTLKVHHTMEEKLDFFSEVEMMKLFKHENIVQLWGVCTRKQPMYAVMEFLLHGDLKTYLLSRRCLVGQGVKEAEDIKAENLTQMAVDIARGLNHLHSLKYIHRDLACRNCLVHANKTVKIADFGLTRHVSSTDYYRFSRKGMLPVRWTAPEALRDGIYSVKSDIWSYGVLVFEIVTFGSFPYQGLSNRQVVEEVVKGTPLKLPLQCNDALRSFIRWCMSADPGYRPDLRDILSYLAYSPAFLTPCIDAPITSVVHEDTDSMGDDAKVPCVSTKLPLLVPSSATLPNFSVVTVGLSSMPNSYSTSNSSALHQQCSIPETVATRAAGGVDNHKRRRSLTRLKLHSIGATCEHEYQGDSWQSGRLREKKKTFSVPGLVFSLGKSNRSGNTRESAATETLGAQNEVSALTSRLSTPCSEALRTSSICGLNACVGGTSSKTNAVRRRFSLGPDYSNSDDSSPNKSNGHSKSCDTSYSDRGGNLQCSSDDGLSNCGWPQSSSAPESIVYDADVEIHCLNSSMTPRFDIQNIAMRRFSSSPNALVCLENSKVNSSGYISENSKGEMKQIVQTITSL